MNLNLYLFEVLNNVIHQSATIDQFVYFLARPFGIMIVGAALLALCLIFVYDTKMHLDTKTVFTELMTVVMSMGVAWFISFIIKIITHIPRPFLTHPNSNTLFLYGGYNSFPSGHATIFFALATAIYYYSRVTGIVFYLCAIAIVLARVASGIHYPIDIIIGAMIGVIIGRLIFMALQKIEKGQKTST